MDEVQALGWDGNIEATLFNPTESAGCWINYFDRIQKVWEYEHYWLRNEVSARGIAWNPVVASSSIQRLFCII